VNGFGYASVIVGKKPMLESINQLFMLTLEDLKSMPPGTVFAHGEIENSMDGLYMTSSCIGRMMLWVAKRGDYHDWVVYAHWADYGIDFVINSGDKVITAENIKKLVPCNDAAFKMYRH